MSNKGNFGLLGSILSSLFEKRGQQNRSTDKMYNPAIFDDINTFSYAGSKAKNIIGAANAINHMLYGKAKEWKTDGDMRKEDFRRAVMTDPEGTLSYYEKRFGKTHPTKMKEVRGYTDKAMDVMYRDLGYNEVKNSDGEIIQERLPNTYINPTNNKRGKAIYDAIMKTDLSDTQKQAMLANSYHETAGWTAMQQYGNGPASGYFMMEKEERDKYEKWRKGREDTPENQVNYIVESMKGRIQTPHDRALKNLSNDSIKRILNADYKSLTGSQKSIRNHYGYTTDQAYEDWNSGDLEKATKAFEAIYERAGEPHVDRRIGIAKAMYDNDTYSTRSKKTKPLDPHVDSPWLLSPLLSDE